MITYLYWAVVLFITAATFLILKSQTEKLKIPAIFSAIILLIGLGLYYFYLEQVFVKRWGGVMHISIPQGQQHITATWKDDNLWVENYDPKTNTCYFTEYSRGNLLEGKVAIKNCNPINRR